MKTKNAKTRSLAGIAAAIAMCGAVNAEPFAPYAPQAPAPAASIQQAPWDGKAVGYWSPVGGPTDPCPYFPTPGSPCYPL